MAKKRELKASIKTLGAGRFNELGQPKPLKPKRSFTRKAKTAVWVTGSLTGLPKSHKATISLALGITSLADVESFLKDADENVDAHVAAKNFADLENMELPAQIGSMPYSWKTYTNGNVQLDRVVILEAPPCGDYYLALLVDDLELARCRFKVVPAKSG